jgi:hypothetical protein
MQLYEARSKIFIRESGSDLEKQYFMGRLWPFHTIVDSAFDSAFERPCSKDNLGSVVKHKVWLFYRSQHHTCILGATRLIAILEEKNVSLNEHQIPP